MTDPKMLSLNSSQRSCWITLLAYASINDNGMITFLSEEQLLVQAGIDPTSEEWSYCQGTLEKFKNLGMIQNDNGVITLLNWQKRQETNLTSYERVKRYREKKRNDNANDNDRVDKKRIEENRIDKKEERESTPEVEAKDFFENGEKQKKVISFLVGKGMSEDRASAEIQKFVLYWTEPNGTGTYQKWQMGTTFDVKRRLLTWMGRIQEMKGGKESKGITI